MPVLSNIYPPAESQRIAPVFCIVLYIMTADRGLSAFVNVCAASMARIKTQTYSLINELIWAPAIPVKSQRR